MAKDPTDDKYVQQFKKHLDEIDEFIQIVLKSHLIMESAIDNVIRLIFFHPDIILDARINFFLKVQIVKAYALHESHMSIWNLMLAIAELRNEIAHNLEGKKRDARMTNVRNTYYSEISPDMAKAHKDYPDHVIVIMASSLCTGFLGEMESDISHLRREIDAMAAARVPRNPDGTPMKKNQEGGYRPATSYTATAAVAARASHSLVCPYPNPDRRRCLLPDTCRPIFEAAYSDREGLLRRPRELFAALVSRRRRLDWHQGKSCSNPAPAYIASQA